MQTADWTHLQGGTVGFDTGKEEKLSIATAKHSQAGRVIACCLVSHSLLESGGPNSKEV